MAIAGKVAITPKGDWKSATAYQKLDLVYYNNGSYVAIQPSTGVKPTNTAYWMLVLQSAGEADLEAIINGATQVGNAKTLDGHGTEYFTATTELEKGAYLLGAVGKDRIILYPDGGTFDSTTDLTGQLRITLPQSWGNTRISFKVGINDLTSKGYFEYIISGYMSTSSAKWTVANAVCNSENAYPVYFAHDGEKNVVCIGNTDTSWQKPKVQIFDVMVGHYSYRYATWSKNWNIAIVTDNSDLTVSATVEKPNVFDNYTETLNQLNSVTVTTSVLEYALTLSTGTYQIYLGGSNYAGDDLPNKSYRYGRATIYKAGGRVTVVLYGIKGVDGAKRLAINHYDSGWSGWDTYSTTADLAKYLPLTGGNVDSLTVANKTVHHDGNSAKVHIGTTAPSDTSAVWIDTSA